MTYEYFIYYLKDIDDYIAATTESQSQYKDEWIRLAEQHKKRIIEAYFHDLAQDIKNGTD